MEFDFLLTKLKKEMEDNQQKDPGTRRVSDALSKMKDNRQRQASNTQSSLTNRPRITNTAPQNNNSGGNSDENGCVWFIVGIVAFFFGFFVLSML